MQLHITKKKKKIKQQVRNLCTFLKEHIYDTARYYHNGKREGENMGKQSNRKIFQIPKAYICLHTQFSYIYIYIM